MKFQASSHLLWLYSPVCVGPGQKPRRPVFSEQGSYVHDAAQFVSSEDKTRKCHYYASLESELVSDVDKIAEKRKTVKT